MHKLVPLLIALIAVLSTTVTMASTGGAKARTQASLAASGAVIKTFSGNGTTVKITSAGNVASFESPTGYQHFFIPDSYAMCYETSDFVGRHAEDGVNGVTNFNPPTTVSTSPLTIRRTTGDGNLQLTQVFKFNASEHALSVQMQVKNTSGSKMLVLHAYRYADIDVDSASGANAFGTAGDDLWVSDSFNSVHAFSPRDNGGHQAHSIVMSYLSGVGDHVFDAVADPQGLSSCIPGAVNGINPYQGDGRAAAHFGIGTDIPNGGTKSITFEYERS